jgi:branched-chain amino acid transport system substrate-binding protein
MKKITLFTLMMAVGLFLAPAAMAADTIPIGAPMPMTGWAAGSGSDYFKGVEMAVNEINESGGLLGKQLEIIRFDSKGFEPEVVTQAADYLCGQKKVTAVFAGWAGWGQDVRAYGKYDAPFFADDGSQAAVDVHNEDPEKYYNIYQTTDVDVNQGRSMARALLALPYKYPNKKLVVINTDDAWGLEIGSIVANAFKEKGWKLSKRETVPYGTNEWGVLLSQIRRIKPALIHVEIPSGQENITFMQQFLKKPSNTIISLGWGIAPREVLDALGTKADGVVGEMPSNIPGPKAPNAKAQAWLDKFAKLYKHQIPAGSWIMYTAVKAWANAVTHVGDPSNFKAVNKYIQENGYEGELGLIKWDKENVLRAQSAAPINHYQVQGGELHTIFTDPPLKAYPGSTFKVPSWIKK